MKPLEQAIVALLDTDPSAGYHVVARSPGICAADAVELAAWGPAPDALVEAGPDSESFNFHPLPSGAYCISRTTPADWQKDGGGQRLRTQCLVVPAEALTRFGNNPFAVIRAASQQCLWRDQDVPGPRLEPLRLSGGAAAVDEALLAQLAVKPGPENMAAMVHAARGAVCLALAGAGSPLKVIAGLFNCLPLECRLEFSFSTGLKFSPWRPFRIVTLSGDPAERLWVGSYANVTVLNLTGDAAARSTSLDGWAKLIERALATGRTAFLAAQLSKRRFELGLNDLPVLGLQLLEELDALEFGGAPGLRAMAEKSPLGPGQRGHGAHHKFQKSATADAATLAAPSSRLKADSPQTLERLERLDDLVYEAIGGSASSMDQLQAAWPKLMAELGEELLVESREQYLRYALSVWEECVDAGGIRNPTRAIQALDVLCLLFGDAA